ncbi:MAG: HAD-IA family hydrolase [Alphaproteobacteria bacterium]|nr:HAD-IA family hydrolase [Alphaproteobacteria bacterium]
MPQIYENFSEIADSFETILVDAYGVFWNGSGFYENSLETLSAQVKAGKQVVIVSNSTQRAEQAVKSYEKRGLIKDKHYNFFVTSGEAARYFLADNTALKNKRLYAFGNPSSLLSDIGYQYVPSPGEAEAFYIGVPQLSDVEADNNSLYEDFLFLSKSGKYDSTIIEPFIPDLKKLYRFGLFAINANPDFYAGESDINGDVHYVVRQGLIAETYRKMGGEVIEFGKPHREIFDYAFKLIGAKDKSKTAMIGDTFRTDILGAKRAGIKALWCVQTGITAEAIARGKSLEEICNNDFSDTYLIKHL